MREVAVLWCLVNQQPGMSKTKSSTERLHCDPPASPTAPSLAMHLVCVCYTCSSSRVSFVQRPTWHRLSSLMSASTRDKDRRAGRLSSTDSCSPVNTHTAHSTQHMAHHERSSNQAQRSMAQHGLHPAEDHCMLQADRAGVKPLRSTHAGAEEITRQCRHATQQVAQEMPGGTHKQRHIHTYTCREPPPPPLSTCVCPQSPECQVPEVAERHQAAQVCQAVAITAKLQLHQPMKTVQAPAGQHTHTHTNLADVHKLLALKPKTRVLLVAHHSRVSEPNEASLPDQRLRQPQASNTAASPSYPTASTQTRHKPQSPMPQHSSTKKQSQSHLNASSDSCHSRGRAPCGPAPKPTPAAAAPATAAASAAAGPADVGSGC